MIKKLIYPSLILLTGAAFYIFSDPGSGISPAQWVLLSGLLIGSLSVYLLLEKKPIQNKAITYISILLFYAIATTLVFYPTIRNIFRQDDWLIMFLFTQTKTLTLQSLKDIALFEMFGHMRFQPLAHFLMFIRYLLFGNNIIFYHILNILLHAFTGFLIFLTLNRLLKDAGLAFVSGMLFLTLPSHFEIVAWTYHIYIIIGTQLALLAIYLLSKYVESDKILVLASAIFFAFISVLLYEPAIIVLGVIIIILSGFYLDKADSLPGKKILLAAGLIFLTGLAYLGVTVYGITIADYRMKADMLISLELILKSVMVTFTNVWAIFIKNIGIKPFLEIKDIVYVNVPADLLGDIRAIVKLVLAVFIISSLRVGKASKAVFVVSCVIMALSYIFIISLGRAITNDLAYVPAQARYQYFPNALLTLSFGVLIYKKYMEKHWRKIVIVALFGFFFWNSQNSMSANKQVAKAIAPFDFHYYRLKDFFDLQPDARVFLDFKPEMGEHFALGTDIAMDILLGEKSTKFVRRATHVYDGNKFREIEVSGLTRDTPHLGDFNVSWDYYRLMSHGVYKEISIVGSKKIYPKISLTPDDKIKVELQNAITGEIETFTLLYPPPPKYRLLDKDKGMHAKMNVIKKGDSLILRFNDVDFDSLVLPSTYKDWNGDGVDLFGGYYKGSGDYIRIANLRICADTTDPYMSRVSTNP